MKKLIALFLVFAVAGMFMVACGGTPAAAPTATPVPTQTTPFVILQHKGTTLGVTDVPKWVQASLEGNSKLEALYPGKYCIVVDFTAGDLEAARVLADKMVANNEIAARIQTRVKAKFAGAQVGDKTKVETYFENVVKTMSEITFTGFTKEADWWIQIRWLKADGKTPDREEFRYLVLYTIDKPILEKQIADVLNGESAKNPPKTEEEKKARDLVNAAISTDF